MVSDMAPQSIAHRRALIGTLSNYMGKVISLGISLLLTPLILQQLGVSGYGLWVLVGTMIAYDWLLGFGIGDALVKYIAEHRARGEIAEIRRLITTGVWLSLAFGVLSFALCAALAPIFPA